MASKTGKRHAAKQKVESLDETTACFAVMISVIERGCVGVRGEEEYLIIFPRRWHFHCACCVRSSWILSYRDLL